MKQIGPRIPKDLYKKVINKCIDEDKNVNQIVVELLIKWVGGEPEADPLPIQKMAQSNYQGIPKDVVKPLAGFANIGLSEDEDPPTVTTDEAQKNWLENL